MPSPEHEFVSETFLSLARQFAKSGIYSCLEAERGRFDFACILNQHKDLDVVGQTLTHHSAGIEKDLNWLLLDSDESIPVYLYADEGRHESRIGEVVRNARQRLKKRVALLRLYPYPVFDADREEERQAVTSRLRRYLVDDLLLNIAFGNLTETDIRIFVSGSGIGGLQLAALEMIATQGFTNFPSLATPIGANPTTLRPRVFNLFAAGMLRIPLGASLYAVTQRGRVFLRVCHLLTRPALSHEAEFILERLGLRADVESKADPSPGQVPEFPWDIPMLRALRNEIAAAKSKFGVAISGGPYLDRPTPLPDGVELSWVER